MLGQGGPLNKASISNLSSNFKSVLGGLLDRPVAQQARASTSVTEVSRGWSLLRQHAAANSAGSGRYGSGAALSGRMRASLDMLRSPLCSTASNGPTDGAHIGPRAGHLSQTTSGSVSRLSSVISGGDCVIEARCLRGLRARFLVASAQGARPKLLAHRTGRVVFSGGRGATRLKQAVEILKSVRPGQIRVTRDVTQMLDGQLEG